MHGINYSESLVDFCHQLPWQPNIGTYYPRGHGLFTNILSLLRQVVVQMSNFSGELGSHYIKHQ